jgi:hypothetical protein
MAHVMVDSAGAKWRERIVWAGARVTDVMGFVGLKQAGKIGRSVSPGACKGLRRGR